MSIIADHISYIYEAGTSFEVRALDDVSFKIDDGEYVGLMGHTGSGKSTLIQHLNGLLKPSSGTVYIDGEDICEKGYDLKKLRGRVGLVFQYPEYQLFEEDVFTDVCFGPKNLGLERAEVELRAYEALKEVGIRDDCFYQSPLELSGGEKRRVALAGVLAMKPEVLILDEPTAGLDPRGREWIFELLKRLNKEQNMTILLISHIMDDLAENVRRLIVMDSGRIAMDGSVRDVFSRHDELIKLGLDIPDVAKVMYMLREKGFNVDPGAVTLKEAAEGIMRLGLRNK